MVSEELNKFFENATRGLEINENSYIIDTDGNEINSVEKAINKYRNHPSVLLIKSTLKNIPSFSFNEVGLAEIERELNLLIRISKFMTFRQRRNIMKGFVESHFGYCPLVWMFCGRQTNARINHIHERALRAVYNDEISPFEELLERDKSETIQILKY